MASLQEQFREQEALRAEQQRTKILTVTNLAIAAGVVVVVFILALVVPKLIPKSAEQRYLDDRELIGKRVAVYSSGFSPTIVRRAIMTAVQAMVDEGLGIQPTFAQTNRGLASALKEEDVGNEEITTLGAKLTNPMGGKDLSLTGKAPGDFVTAFDVSDVVGFSATPSWEDVDGDGKRNPANDKLFYHNASPEPAVDHWNTLTVTVEETDYVVDSRDYFIDFDLLLEGEYLEIIPESASPDNSVDGAGSYSWYLDENLEVRSMLYTEPVPAKDGYQEGYP